MKLAVIGTGYVGLVAGACLAESGHDVVCLDLDEEKIAYLNRRKIPIYEPGLEEIVTRNVDEGRLSFSTSIGAVVRLSEVVFIAVGTPPNGDGQADLKNVVAAAETIGQHMERYTIIVTKSTVPVGTADIVRETIQRHTKVAFDVVANPEFLKEGHAVEDFLKPERIIIGSSSERAQAIMDDIYAPFNRTTNRTLHMDVRSAEMTKYAANAMLATRISFMNEISLLCEKVGADIQHVRHGIGADSRIGSAFLFPGVGYGGSCFPKDIKALIATGRGVDQQLQILEAVERVNERQKAILVDKVVNHFGEDLNGLTMAIWGLSFKPRTDDMREAPSITVANGLLDRGARVRAHDPVAIEVAHGIFGDRIELCRRPYEALEGADALLVVTEWNEFRRPDFERMKGLMRSPVVFDGRNIYNHQKMVEMGFNYFCIGRPVPNQSTVVPISKAAISGYGSA